jgi:hypothetical protein
MAVAFTVEEGSPVKAQVEQIRRDVEKTGECVASSEDLRVLCVDEVAFTDQFDRVSDIAQQEGWTFAFQTNGSVRFAKLPVQTMLDLADS